MKLSKISVLLSSNTVLALYDPNKEMKISADSSFFGLGAVLLQKAEGEWRPVAYASRSLTRTETRYAQVEKEALAVTWACERFHLYVSGRDFQVETDQKPLISLLEKKLLDQLPPRILSFRLRLMQYTYSISHVPGKQFATANTLSRAPGSKEIVPQDQVISEDAEAFINMVINSLPATVKKLEEIKVHTAEDEVLQQVVKYC